MTVKQIENVMKLFAERFGVVSPDLLVNSLVFLYLKKHEISQKTIMRVGLELPSQEICNFLKENISQDFSIVDVMSFYEKALPTSLRAEKGITFTPEYIATYIVDSLIARNGDNLSRLKLLDPSCGLGIFLLVALRILKSQLNCSAWDILADNIFGIDLLESNVKLTAKILIAECCVLEHGVIPKSVSYNLRCCDSLKVDWSELFGVSFDAIVGNPPYVNPHDLAKEVKDFLKQTFATASTGTTNIYYAFIEHAVRFINERGALSYIVPNNFLTITAAKELRSFLVRNSYISRILDFTDNMPFAPVRTYNAIALIDRTNKDAIKYARIESCPANLLPQALRNATWCNVPYTYLQDEHRWTLLSPHEQDNIRKIEGQTYSIRQFIKTGIATLKDGAYLVAKTASGAYEKVVAGEHYSIEADVVRPIYKISEINPSLPVEDSVQYIIFPYRRQHPQSRPEIIPEDEFAQNYPGAYAYLRSQAEALSERDKGKANPVAWYAYGRTQGINFYGKKLVYPTFTNIPKFRIVEDKGALFCNGYAIFESPLIPIDVLMRILNSKIMRYYVDKTSYPIEGGFMCYQKKYIERFSVPDLTEEQISNVRSIQDDEELNCFLCDLYLLPRAILA